MLATEKIAKSFIAIIEEAEKAMQTTNSEEMLKGLKTIISIAKHQSDIRDAKSGDCKPHSTCKSSKG
jgi:hypothetical protein